MGKKRITLSLRPATIEMAAKAQRRHGLRSLSATIDALLIAMLSRPRFVEHKDSTLSQEIEDMFDEMSDAENKLSHEQG